MKTFHIFTGMGGNLSRLQQELRGGGGRRKTENNFAQQLEFLIVKALLKIRATRCLQWFAPETMRAFLL